MKNYNLFLKDYEILKPLTNDELNAWFKKMQNGDSDALRIIVEHNIRLVLYIVRKNFKAPIYDQEELVEIGNIGLMKAINTFDISKNIRFSSYACICIKNEIGQFLRHEEKKVNTESLEKTIIYNKDGSELKLLDIIADNCDIASDYIRNDCLRIIREFVYKLPKREGEIIKMRFGFYGKVYNQQEIAEKFSLTQPTISRTIVKVINIIRNILTAYGIIEKNCDCKSKTNNKY